ncbi:putative esterase [Fibrella aestuarina BUZ 2]|uniref:Putative esterase n=1 Tax=Fibrella aestuarina BUZ 2 TaxID=1166018 RepID=I0KGM3_9BACT|nr:alpha/beta hydrolase-fold protein [Fibrella aestuarina]CCH03276.1 putative esterase [Fibrella aestuarina BUZ 2]
MNRLVALLLVCYTSLTYAQPVPRPVAGTIRRMENVASRFVEPRHVDIWLPAGYSANKQYAVVYMHDGQMLFDSATTWNHQSWDVDDVATSLLAAHQVQDFIVVGVWNAGKSRHANYFPQKPYASLTTEQKAAVNQQLQAIGRTTEPFQPNSDAYLKFLVTELKPHIDSTYAVYTDRAHTFVAGSSMGGLISLYALCEYPAVFGGAACLSTHWPGIFSVDNNPVPAAFFDYLRTRLPDPKTHKLYFDYGDQTLDALYPPLQQQADAVMRTKGYTVTNWTTRFFPGENHSEQAWHKRLAIPLTFLLTN